MATTDGSTNGMRPAPSGALPSTGKEREKPPLSTFLALADRLLSQFRPVQGCDPRVFLTSIASVMMHYPLDVLEEVCDPFFGLPGRQNFSPTPYDVRKMCEEKMRPRREAAAYKRRTAKQLAERDRPEDRAGRPTLEGLGAEMAARGMMLPSYAEHLRKRDEAANAGLAAATREKFHLTQEQWDALPNSTHQRAP